jgi:predicted GNAT family N-acyltransferase
VPADEHLSNQFKSVYESEHGSARVTPSGYVYNVSIRHDVRGQGKGTELMGAIATDADRLGRPLSLHAREDLHPWYRRLGFEEDTRPAAELEKRIMGQPLLIREPRRRGQ